MPDARNCHLRHCPTAAHLRRPPPPPPSGSPYPRQWAAAHTPRFWYSHQESINRLNPRTPRTSWIPPNNGFFYQPQILREDETLLLNLSGLERRRRRTPGFSDHHRQHPVVLRQDETMILDLPDHHNMSYDVVLRQDETMILELPDHHNMSYDEDSGGLSEETIVKHLKTRAVRDADKDQVCVVCQFDLFQESDGKIATLHCGHEYHAECITKWLEVKKYCPMCKADAVVFS